MGRALEEETQTTIWLKQDKRKKRYPVKIRRGRKYEQEINVLVT